MASFESEEADKDFWTLEAMEYYGGSFVKKLSQAAQMADPKNLQKIKDTWPEYWKEYEVMGAKLKNNR